MMKKRGDKETNHRQGFCGYKGASWLKDLTGKDWQRELTEME